VGSAAAGDAEARPRKRRSRWEDGQDALNLGEQVSVGVPSMGGAMVVRFPKEIMLSGGIKVG
jgi:hypothetical protein